MLRVIIIYTFQGPFHTINGAMETHCCLARLWTTLIQTHLRQWAKKCITPREDSISNIIALQAIADIIIISAVPREYFKKFSNESLSVVVAEPLSHVQKTKLGRQMFIIM